MQTRHLVPLSVVLLSAACDPTTSNAGFDIPQCAEAHYFDTMGGLGCIATTECSYGQYEAMAPTPFTDRECAAISACPEEFFEAVPPTANEDRVCVPLRQCTSSEFELVPAGPTTDRICVPISTCEDNEFESAPPTLTSDRQCLRVTECVPGQFEAAPPSATTDRDYQAITQCTDAEFEVAGPTDTSDRTCSPTTECTVLEFETLSPTPTSDRECAPLTVCTPSEFEAAGPTDVTDRECQALTTCDTSSQFELTAPTPTADRTCGELTVCSPDQYETAAPTATSDRSCTSLTVCDATMFELVPPSPVSDRECSPLTVCTAGEFELLAPTAVSNRLCSPLSVCDDTQYEALPPSLTQDRICLPFTSCIVGQEYEAVAPTATSDRICLSYSVCGPLEWEAVASTPTSDCVCLPHSTCGTTEYEAAAPTLTSDRECAPVTVCTWTEFEAIAPTLVSDRVCTPHTECTDSQFEVTAASPFGDRVCADHSTCNTDQFEAIPASPFADVVCAPVTQCGGDEFELAPPAMTSDRICAPISNCSATEFEAQAPTATTDRDCAPLSVCSGLEFESVPPTATADRTCQLLTLCADDQFELVAPTATTDRVCQTMTTCGPGEYEASPPTATSDATCEDITACAPGTCESAAPTATSDRVCSMGACPVLTWTEEVTPGWQCQFGGTTTFTGRDDGQPGGTAADGLLDPQEIEDETLSCFDAPPVAKIAPTGLDSLPENSTCLPPSGSSRSAGVTTRRAFAKLVMPPDSGCVPGITASGCASAHHPTAMVQHPVSTDWYIAEQGGRILRFVDDEETTEAALLLDIRARVVSGYEAGLLNLSFDPQNPDYLYVYYITCVDPTAPADEAVVCDDGNELLDNLGIVSRFTLQDDGTIDTESELVILQVVQDKTEHNGAGGRIGPDGYLYVAFGDGGKFPVIKAQDPQSLMGKVLRLAVNDDNGAPYQGDDPPYTIPADNPFVDDPTVRDEIYAIGFRNPWRFDFDVTVPSDEPQRLVLGDVGLVTAEEINVVEAGNNHGWPLMEGNHCRPTGDDALLVTVLPDAECTPPPGMTPPAYTYSQAKGVSVTGGFSYRGTAIPSLIGKYIFADFSNGFIQALDLENPSETPRFLLDAPSLISGFAQGLDGDVFYFDWWSGHIHKLEPVSTEGTTPDTLLTQTGCVNPEQPLQPAPGGLRYSVQAPLFSEGLHKTRWVYLPAGAQATEYNDSGNLILQPGSVLMKHFDIDGRRIETRIFYRHNDGESDNWSGWSYRWREDQTDAELVENGFDESFENIDWHYPTQGECMHCHTLPAGRSLGFNVRQLNGLAYYPETDRWANQVDTLRTLAPKYHQGEK